jgi:hypothetical protein
VGRAVGTLHGAERDGWLGTLRVLCFRTQNDHLVARVSKRERRRARARGRPPRRRERVEGVQETRRGRAGSGIACPPCVPAASVSQDADSARYERDVRLRSGLSSSEHARIRAPRRSRPPFFTARARAQDRQDSSLVVRSSGAARAASPSAPIRAGAGAVGRSCCRMPGCRWNLHHSHFEDASRNQGKERESGDSGRAPQGHPPTAGCARAGPIPCQAGG